MPFSPRCPEETRTYSSYARVGRKILEKSGSSPENRHTLHDVSAVRSLATRQLVAKFRGSSRVSGVSGFLGNQGWRACITGIFSVRRLHHRPWTSIMNPRYSLNYVQSYLSQLEEENQGGPFFPDGPGLFVAHGRDGDEFFRRQGTR